MGQWVSCLKGGLLCRCLPSEVAKTEARASVEVMVMNNLYPRGRAAPTRRLSGHIRLLSTSRWAGGGGGSRLRLIPSPLC